MLVFRAKNANSILSSQGENRAISTRVISKVFTTRQIKSASAGFSRIFAQTPRPRVEKEERWSSPHAKNGRLVETGVR